MKDKNGHLKPQIKMQGFELYKIFKSIILYILHYKKVLGWKSFTSEFIIY